MKTRLMSGSVNLKRIFFRFARRGCRRRLLGDINGFAALLVFSRFDCVEPFAKPSFFRPAPVAVDVRIAVSGLGSHSNKKS